jgi:hypothetical protein
MVDLKANADWSWESKYCSPYNRADLESGVQDCESRDYKWGRCRRQMIVGWFGIPWQLIILPWREKVGWVNSVSLGNSSVVDHKVRLRMEMRSDWGNHHEQQVQGRMVSLSHIIISIIAVITSDSECKNTVSGSCKPNQVDHSRDCLYPLALSHIMSIIIPYLYF